MELRITTFASASGPAAASTFVDSSDSLDWGGITGVLLANEETVPFDLTSASGTDWRQSFAPAVPEPSTYALLFAGLWVVLLSSRRVLRHRPAAIHFDGSSMIGLHETGGFHD